VDSKLGCVLCPSTLSMGHKNVFQKAGQPAGVLKLAALKENRKARKPTPPNLPACKEVVQVHFGI